MTRLDTAKRAANEETLGQALLGAIALAIFLVALFIGLTLITPPARRAAATRAQSPVGHGCVHGQNP